ncbi:SpoVT/AbrB domain protein [Caenispirillum salinarum AK4]|uniref:SpoVT/AbrB domain protein n=1 Tax=Caenispirillum salinarum AK4 TaxID=1238182 RepID=K9GQ79_9PROT|nr:SpoVT/AbrB domain protein [Caenispirillum salinarum]EKV27312.1 SpoVT/AbrB domain protein [Caenispirillum salinarum AK4]
MNAQRTLKIIREGGEQRISLPADMQFPGDEVTVTREGDRLVIAPKRRKTLIELFDEWDDLDEDFPDPEDPPPEPVDF